MISALSRSARDSDVDVFPTPVGPISTTTRGLFFPASAEQQVDAEDDRAGRAAWHEPATRLLAPRAVRKASRALIMDSKPPRPRPKRPGGSFDVGAPAAVLPDGEGVRPAVNIKTVIHPLAAGPGQAGALGFPIPGPA